MRIVKIYSPEEFRAELECEGIREIRRDYIRRTRDSEIGPISYGFLVLTAEKDGTIYRHEEEIFAASAIFWDNDEKTQKRILEARERAERWLQEFFKGFTIRPGIIVISR